MRSELKNVNISSGIAMLFTKTWFSTPRDNSVAFNTAEEVRITSDMPEKPQESKTEVKSVGDTTATRLTKKITIETTSQEKDAIVTNGDKQQVPEGTTVSALSEQRSECRNRSASKELDGGKIIPEINGTADNNNNKSKESVEKKQKPMSNKSENQGGKSSKKKASPNYHEQEISNLKSVERKFCNRRPFGEEVGDLRYEKGTALCNTVENEKIEFKALTQENQRKLPWKIMDKARIFICGVLNSGERGTIYFGIGDSIDKSTNFNHGEVIGLEVEDLMDDINKAFQSMVDDHIKSDDGSKLNSGEMKAVKSYFVPVWEASERTSRYVVEIDVQRDWAFCKDHVYFIEMWEESDKWKNSGKKGRDDFYKVKKGHGEQAYIRTCGASQSIKARDINKIIKEPLAQMYEDSQEEKRKKKLPPMFTQETPSMLDTQKTSIDIRESLKYLREEIDYIFIGSKVPQKYRGLGDLAFLKSIPWYCVFDLFDQKSKADGLYYILNETNDSAKVIVKALGDFNDPKTEISNRTTTWILRDNKMHESDWTRNSKHCLYKALSACNEGSLASKHWVFLCLNDESLVEMADVIELLFTILGNNASTCITIFSEKKDMGERLMKPLKNSIQKDLKYPRSFFGLPLNLLKTIVQEMRPNCFHEPGAMTDLPSIYGLKSVLNKRINSLTDLEVYCPKPSFSSTVPGIKKSRGNFYKGDAVQQLNLFHRHDIKRTIQDQLTHQIDRCVKKLSNPYEQEYTGFVETVNLSYEPGSGATTLCRRILWDKRETLRCAVIKSINTDTDFQINELQRFSYEIDSSLIPPVLILVDKFPEQNVFRLIDKLSERKTKCILLTTTPITSVAMGSEDAVAELGQLDDVEIQRVKEILTKIEDKDEKKIKAAEEVLEKKKRFIWLGLELFGQQCVAIEERLSNHIHQIISIHSITDRLKDAYEMILHFCCFLDYYSKGQYIYPHACILDILDENYDLDEDCTDQIKYVHDKFGGLLLDDHSETNGYRGWRPAHFLVGEIIRKEMDLVATVKKFFTEAKNNDTHAKKILINDIVQTCLRRDSICKNSSTSEEDPDLSIEDDDFSMFDKQKYSSLLLDAMPRASDSDVTDGLDILLAINTNVETDEQKAHSWQQLARVLAYEVGTKMISHKDITLLSQLPLPSIDQIPPNDSSLSGFKVAHEVIDLAVRLQPTYVHHLVTKGTFFRTELQSKLLETIQPDFASSNLQDFSQMVIEITKKGTYLYDCALKKTAHDDGYLYAMIGKIHIIIILLEIIKKLPCFFFAEQGPDECFKSYMTFGTYPEELNSTLTEKDLDYFLSLRSTPSQMFDEFFKEITERRKRSFKKHKTQKIKNANTCGERLRKKFYDVTKLDRTHMASYRGVLKEGIVDDILYKHDETPYTAWKKLTPEAINQIYEYLQQAIPKETTSNKAMLIFARASLNQSNVILDDLSQHVKLWLTKCSNSKWANLFNFMIHFPVPNGSLQTNVPAVNRSIEICKGNNITFVRQVYRKSSAMYFLGKGSGVNAILPSHVFEASSRKEEVKTASNGVTSRELRDTEFWRSKYVYAKLERLCGQKVLGKKGVLDYKGIEIMFDNERYPKESRDDLWFCLGFTLQGPYAYDPVDGDTFNTIKQSFSEEKRKVYSDAVSQKVCSTKPSDKPSKSATPAKTLSQSSNNVPAPSQIRPSEDETLVFPKEIQSCSIKNDSWKTNKNLIVTRRVLGGHQVSFKPQRNDSIGRVFHGALVKGAFKSVKCQGPSERCSSGRCLFAHPSMNDPIRQTVCTLCTENKREYCDRKDEHKEYFLDLGPFRHMSGKIWGQY